MADNKLYMQYRYKVEMTYLNIVKNINTPIVTECIKSIIIDHNYDNNCMPIIYAILKLDKALVDDMILNINDNLMLVTVYKYDELSNYKEEIEVFRDRFTYFLPDDVNKNDPIDYNETNENETLGNTYRSVSLGLMSIKMINRNKRLLELNVSNNTIFDCVKYCTSDIDNLIIEPFSFNDKYDRIIMPAQESINSALKFLNSYRVFYYTPYRYYQDFNHTYIISSSGREIPRDDEIYSTVVIDIKDITDNGANDIGVIVNKTSETYEIPINYVNTNIYNNNIVNKSYNKIKAVSSTESNIKTLNNNASYSDEKIKFTRLNNDNNNMIYNIESENNSNNIFVYFSKNDLDMDILTINKRISINMINRYQQYNGDYLLTRKRECLLREDKTFVMTTMINMKRIERTNNIIATYYTTK